MRGFPHSDEPEKAMMEELWVGVTLSGRSPMKRIPMKRDPEGDEAKGGGLDINNGSLKLERLGLSFILIKKLARCVVYVCVDVV